MIEMQDKRGFLFEPGRFDLVGDFAEREMNERLFCTPIFRHRPGSQYSFANTDCLAGFKCDRFGCDLLRLCSKLIEARRATFAINSGIALPERNQAASPALLLLCILCVYVRTL
jgi:hypothetical protein